jgi:serine/threonine protein kinase
VIVVGKKSSLVISVHLFCFIFQDFYRQNCGWNLTFKEGGIISENVVRVYKQCADQNLFFIEMEYVNGGTLLDLFKYCLKENKFLPLKDVWILFLELLKGIDGTCCILFAVTLKIADFDVSSFFDESFFSNALHGTYLYSVLDLVGLILKKEREKNRSYSVPEKIKDSSVSYVYLDKTNMFALGLILTEILTARFSFLYEKNLNELVNCLTHYDPNEIAKNIISEENDCLVSNVLLFHFSFFRSYDCLLHRAGQREALHDAALAQFFPLQA